MRVAMCDGCKEIFKPYGKLIIDGKSYQGNMFSTAYLAKDGKVNPKMRADLCPKCMEKLHRFLYEELNIDTANKPYLKDDSAEQQGPGENVIDEEDPPVSGGEVTLN